MGSPIRNAPRYERFLLSPSPELENSAASNTFASEALAKYLNLSSSELINILSSPLPEFPPPSPHIASPLPARISGVSPTLLETFGITDEDIIPISSTNTDVRAPGSKSHEKPAIGYKITIIPIPNVPLFGPSAKTSFSNKGNPSPDTLQPPFKSSNLTILIPDCVHKQAPQSNLRNPSTPSSKQRAVPSKPRIPNKIQRPSKSWVRSFVEKQKTPPALVKSTFSLPVQPASPNLVPRKDSRRVYGWHGLYGKFIDENGAELEKEEAMKRKRVMEDDIKKVFETRQDTLPSLEAEGMKEMRGKKVRSKKLKRSGVLVDKTNACLDEVLKTKNRWWMSKSASLGERSDYAVGEENQELSVRDALKLESKIEEFNQDYMDLVECILKEEL